MSYGNRQAGGHGVKRWLRMLLTAGALALAGCGGGGSTSSTLSPSNPAPEGQPEEQHLLPSLQRTNR